MEKTTIYLPGELQRSLRDLARREGRSQAEIVRSALEVYTSSRTPPRVRSIGAGVDEGVSGAASEQWLRTHWRKKNTRKPGR